jgi:hypothetical protein
MENNEVLQPGTNEELPDAAPRPENERQVIGENDMDGLAVIDFTEEELHMVVSALINLGRDIKEEYIHRSFHARADKYFDLALRLDEEYAEYFLTED